MRPAAHLAPRARDRAGRRGSDPRAARRAAAQPVELPPERRPTWSSLAVLAAACGLGAVLLGLGAVLWPGDDPSPVPSSSPALEQAVSILADPAVERIVFAGSVGRLVLLVGRQGDAVLAHQRHRTRPRGSGLPGVGDAAGTGGDAAGGPLRQHRPVRRAHRAGRARCAGERHARGRGWCDRSFTGSAALRLSARSSEPGTATP